MRISWGSLKDLVSRVFGAAGCDEHERERVAHYLVQSNLVGHDSHGVIRVPTYIQWLREGKVVANRHARVILQGDCLAVVDGQYGFGQVIGEEAVRLGIAKSAAHGVSVVALRDCGHLGRIGDWPTLAAEAGRVSLHFVNTSGAGNLVAPVGAVERRLSANPIAMGVPVAGGPPILLDISTCSIAEGKIKVAFNKGVDVPPGCIIDSRGRPTTDPRVFYADPPGAILPFGGHKGYALGFLAEMLAGALTGNGCTAPGVGRLSNGMLSIYVNPAAFRPEDEFQAEIARFIEFAKSARRADEAQPILVPGEPESITRARREKDGIELDDATWGQIAAACQSLGVAT